MGRATQVAQYNMSWASETGPSFPYESNCWAMVAQPVGNTRHKPSINCTKPNPIFLSHLSQLLNIFLNKYNNNDNQILFH